MAQVAHPFIIDVEASGFGPHGYPIEVGLALEPGQRFSTLVRPQPQWTYWDEQAESCHKIPRSILDVEGKSLTSVADTLNTLLAGKTVYTDGWVVDKPWVVQLFEAARTAMNFSISALEMILSEPQMLIWHQTKSQVQTELDQVRHRASHDARIIQETYLRTLRLTASIPPGKRQSAIADTTSR